ncbi:hypothetical protein [Vibrio sp. N418]|uniref:hypothetical protein n=1 Tax=Vibrio sp. (strain N418) TaxID=701176 RepID=UPI001111EC56|nr:hypothetical protein [Vibrio sp. N418]
MNDYVIAYKALKKSNRARLILSCFCELSGAEKLQVALQLFVLGCFFIGLVAFDESKNILFMTAVIWGPVAYSLMVTLSDLPAKKYQYLGSQFDEVIKSRAFNYDYARVFMFIEFVNELQPQGINYSKVRDTCDIELRSMAIAPILVSPLPTFFVAFLASSLTYGFWQTNNEDLFVIGILGTLCGGYLIYLFVTGKSWVHDKIVRLRKYCELISLMTDEQRSVLAVKIF